MLRSSGRGRTSALLLSRDLNTSWALPSKRRRRWRNRIASAHSASGSSREGGGGQEKLRAPRESRRRQLLQHRAHEAQDRDERSQALRDVHKLAGRAIDLRRVSTVASAGPTRVAPTGRPAAAHLT